MYRFVSKRSSSSVDLDSASLDDVRAERAAIALFVGLSWPPDRYTKTRSALLAENESSRPGGDQEKPSIVPPQPQDSLKTSPAAVFPSVARPMSILSPATGSSKRRWDMQRCSCEVQRRCPRVLDGINPNTPYRRKRSAPRAALLGRRCLSPADMTRLSEHIMRVTDVLFLSGLTIHGLVLDWLDAEGKGNDVCPGREWVRRLLRGMHALEQQEARQVISTPTRTGCSSSCAG